MESGDAVKPVPVIFGEVLFDCFEDGNRVLGGAPFNVAWNLQAFGAAPLLISRVGDDASGRRIRDTMQQWGMNAAGLQRDCTHPTGTVKVTLREGEPDFEIVADQAYDFIQDCAMPPFDAALIYHGSLGLRRPEAKVALESLKISHPAPVFLDVNLRPPWWEAEAVRQMLDGSTWAKLNENELKTLCEGQGDLRSRAENLLHDHALELIIVTRGSRGAFALNQFGDYEVVVPQDEISVVDTVGAGDAFASVCILGLLRQWDLKTLLFRAHSFASALVGRQGATVLDPVFYQQQLRRWKV